MAELSPTASGALGEFASEWADVKELACGGRLDVAPSAGSSAWALRVAMARQQRRRRGWVSGWWQGVGAGASNPAGLSARGAA